MSDRTTPFVQITLALLISIGITNSIITFFNISILWGLLIFPISLILLSLLFLKLLPPYWWWPNHIEDRTNGIKRRLERGDRE